MKKHLKSTILGCMALLCLLTGCHSSELIEAFASVQPTDPIISRPIASDAIQSNPSETENMNAAEEGLLSRSNIQHIYYGSMGTLLRGLTSRKPYGFAARLRMKPSLPWRNGTLYRKSMRKQNTALTASVSLPQNCLLASWCALIARVH